MCSTRVVPSLGCVNGYLSVPNGHPWHGKYYVDADVHGGLTYAADRVPIEPHPQAIGDEWVLGFDTAHAGDFVPKLPFSRRGDDREWSEDDVSKELRKLADQAASATNK